MTMREQDRFRAIQNVVDGTVACCGTSRADDPADIRERYADFKVTLACQ